MLNCTHFIIMSSKSLHIHLLNIPFFPGVPFSFQAHLSTAVYPCSNTALVRVLCYICIKSEREPGKKLLAPPTYFSMSQTVGTKSFSLNMPLLSKKLCLEKSRKHFCSKTQHSFLYETQVGLFWTKICYFTCDSNT